MKNPYDDIIELPHHVSMVHPRMSMYNRAAQFAPFAALAGHDAAIGETARLTDEQILLTQEELVLLDRKIAYLLQNKEVKPNVAVTYFEPDETKCGGMYRTVSGVVKMVDTDTGVLVMSDGLRIHLNYIKSVEGDLFGELE